jgi:hypothetical protein
LENSVKKKVHDVVLDLFDIRLFCFVLQHCSSSKTSSSSAFNAISSFESPLTIFTSNSRRPEHHLYKDAKKSCNAVSKVLEFFFRTSVIPSLQIQVYGVMCKPQLPFAPLKTTLRKCYKHPVLDDVIAKHELFSEAEYISRPLPTELTIFNEDSHFHSNKKLQGDIARQTVEVITKSQLDYIQTNELLVSAGILRSLTTRPIIDLTIGNDLKNDTNRPYTTPLQSVNVIEKSKAIVEKELENLNSQIEKCTS